MTADLKPLHVSDVRDDAYWYSVRRDQGDALRAWLRANSLEPNDIYRFEVYLCDTLFAKVFTYARDQRGRLVIEGEDVVRREPFLAPLASMPPALENRSAESHAEPRTRPGLSHDTGPAPKTAPRPPQPRARLNERHTCA